MSTVNKYLLPHRATKDVMKDASKSSMVLRKGELFVEAPSTGIGTGHSKIKIGDGKTIYSNLPYALGDTDNEVTNAIITFISNTGTSAKDVINGVKSGQSLATQIAGLKQAITLIANTPFTNKAFSTISDGGNQSIAATGTGDILKVTAGDNVTLTMDNSVKSIKIAAKDTTYNNATTTTSGLMSSGDKKRFDGMSDGANKTAVEQKLFSGTNIGSVTIDGKKTELFAPTNTHYEAKNVVNNSSTSTSNTSTTVDNGNVTLNLVEDGKVRSSHKISGSGATKVTTDDSGNIIVSSTDNNTTYGQASDTKAGLTKIYGIYGDNTDGSVTQQFFTDEMNKKLSSDGTAVKANQDSLGNNIVEYFRDASVNGQTVTFVRGNGTTVQIHTQDENNKYYDFKGATTAAAGGNGLVPAPSTAQTGYYLRGDGTWHSPSDVKVDKAGMADKASTATADSAGNNINTTYIKSVTGSNATVTVTKGNGATTSFTINNVSSATSAGSARSASTATADSAGQQINTTYVKGVTGAAAVVTVTKGDGTTTGFTVDGVKSASSATADSAGQNINTTYIKGVTGSNATVTVTKGNGATSAFIVNNVSNAGTATYAESASTATVDSAGQQINTTYIKSLSVSGRTITYTKGNGATSAITTQDNNTTYGAFKGATSSANGGSGLVPAPTTAQKDQYLKGDGTWASISNVISGTKVDNASTADYASSASSASTATADSAGQQINTTYIKGVTGSNATLTVTKGNGSTSAFTVNNVSNAAKASTATADSAGQQINTTYIKSITYSGHTVTVTKGNGFTSTFDTADNNTTYATGNETTSGLTKLYGSSGTSTDGTMTRAAITKLVNDTKTTLETAIGNINSFEIIVLADGETLPTTGANHTVYFVPDASGDADTKYAEYIWLTDYYEKIGMTTADLTNYYTKSETDNKISFATDSLVSSLSYSGHTLTITKKNGTTSSFNTTDNNTTYSAGTGLSLSGTTFSINAGASTVAHASSADRSTNDSAGNNINNTYVKGITYSGHTVTITKGNGATTSFNTADNNTTYDVFKGATNSANGGTGLVPAPTTSQTGMYLKGDGTWANINGVIAGTKVNNASTADYASSASNSTKATNDSAGQQINTTYIKSLSVSGRTITYTKGNGATAAITTQDTNTTYNAFKGATSSANGGPGLVPAPTTANANQYLKGDGTWANISGVIAGTKVNNASEADHASRADNAATATADSAGQIINTTYVKGVTGSNATVTVTKGDGSTSAFTVNNVASAGKATNDSAGQNINTTYIKSITYSGHTVTVTKGNGTTSTFDTADNNTTYVTGTETTSGLTKLYGSTGTSTDGTMTRAAITNLVAQTKSALETTIGKINSFEIVVIDQGGSLPTTGADHTVYFLPYASGDSDTKYEEYIWLTDYYEKIGMTTADLGNYYTKSETNSQITNATNSLVSSVTYSGHTVTITKKDGSTSSFATADNNTTYNAGTGLSLSGTTFSINAGASTVAHASSADSSTNDSAGNNINTTYVKGITYSGHTVTITKGNGATTSFNTADNNTTYVNFKGATSSANGNAGLVPAPTTAQTGMYLKGDGTWANISGVIAGTKVNNASTADYASSASNATKATNDSAGQNINTTYIKSLSVSGRTITYTKGNGATGTITTQDTNTTYNAFKGATSSANGGPGLVPGPTSAQVGMYLRGDGTWHSPTDVKVSNASHADSADNASNATNASTATYAKTAGSANAVAWGNISGKPSTYTPSAHTHTSIESVQLTNQDLNNYKSNSVQFLFAGGGNTVANKPSGVDAFGVYTYRSAQGFYTQELVDTNGTKYLRFCNSTSWTAWKTIVDSSNVAGYKVNNAGYADSAGKATNDSAGQNINTTYIKNLAVSGRTITFTKGNGATGTITTQDSNTTYSAGTGLSLSGTTFSINAGASTVAHASSADSSTKDSAGNNINNTYIKNLSVNGRTITFTKGNGSTTAITTQDTNTTYDVFKGATSSANGGNGLVPAPTTAQKDMYLKGDGTWANISGVIVGTKVTSAANADSAGKATNDSAGQNINTTYIKSLSVSGRTITYTKGNGATGTITTQDTDTNTTYSAGTGLTLSGTTFSINAGASTVAYATNAGNGISNITRSGTTFTVTRQNGSTFSFNQQDTNTTYGLASQSSNGLMSAADKKAVDREFFRMLPKGGTHIPAKADLNTIQYLKVGNYYNSLNAETGTMKNCPSTNAFMMYVLSPLSEEYDNESTSQWVYRLRIFIEYAGTGMFVQRVFSDATPGNFSYGPWIKLTNSNDLAAVSKIINDHIANKSNPHAVTKAQVGLGSVANLDQSKAIKSITRSGTTFTATALDGTTTTFTQQDNNSTYNNFKGATTATAGGNGLVPAPTTAQVGFYLRGDGTWHSPSDVKANNAGYSDSAGKATNDSAGNNINTTYIKSLAVSGRTITYTKGNGGTGTITTQDTNTTYSAGTGLSLSGTTFSINAGASTVAYATNAGNGISNITRSGTTFTVTRQNGSTFSFNQQDSNTTYGNFKGATTAAAGGPGLVPAPAKAQDGLYLRGDGTWHSPSDVKANNAGYADSAGKATNDSAGNNINNTYIKSLSVSGRVITYTKGNGATGSFQTQDTNTNTTYSAGTGLSLSGTTFSINAGASTVAYATNAGNASKATGDSAGNNINSTYIKSITYSGHTVTITKGNGATTSFNTADNNTTYSALKNPNALTISLNGTSQGAYDGSAAKSINITPASIGAAASNHSHSNYVAKAGDTMTGALKLTKGSTAGCTLDYNATNSCLSFVFS